MPSDHDHQSSGFQEKCPTQDTADSKPTRFKRPEGFKLGLSLDAHLDNIWEETASSMDLLAQ